MPAHMERTSRELIPFRGGSIITGRDEGTSQTYALLTPDLRN